MTRRIESSAKAAQAKKSRKHIIKQASVALFALLASYFSAAQAHAALPKHAAAPAAAHAAAHPHPPHGQHGCVPRHAAIETQIKQFDYNPREALAVRTLSVTEQDGASVSDLTYQAQGQSVSAYLVEPPRTGRFAAVIYMHWLDDSPSANRTEFLNEATTLAKQGVVSLLVQGVYPWQEKPKDIVHDCQATIRQTVALRRGLDLLSRLKHVDQQRILYVGHDYGAMYGAILSAFEKRIKGFALLAPSNRFSTWNVPFFLDTLNPAERLDYIVATASLDPMTYVGLAQSPVFLQFARQDRFMSLVEINDLLEVASGTATYQLYAADHSLTDGISQLDRLAWIAQEAGLSF